ncbi:PIG-L family deacetylase [Prevotella copri]|uniref:PIG-L deacetylase family protein n=1 Tax=Segatella copri TaxID=165179 RepID=UPI0022360AB5|nr:PIG-L family deacetylase [Segatella copri]MCW4415492.1 PIG-L family deacetylase [Segatella copri]MCW4422573.1 PIG-L family deacetylase [Segatella copri]
MLNYSVAELRNKIKEQVRILRVDSIRLRAKEYPSFSPSNLSVIVAPHPDDEVFGCCGLMQRLIALGKRVELIIMTGGGKSHAGCCDIDENELIRQRRQLTIRAAKEYGLSQEYIHFLDYPDGGVLESDSQTKKLSNLLQKLVDGQDDVSVFYPHKNGEGWSDHVTTSNIVSHLFDRVSSSLFLKTSWKHPC